MSPLQLRNSDFVAQLRKVLGPEGANRAPLDIEITEGVLVDKSEEVIQKLNEIRHMGVRVAIDDFGTGYSSLRYLAHLPIDTLKIDRSFVTAMTNNADDMAIVSSIISLAHGLDINVVAEGVESEEQYKLLQLLRCDQMQGYLFSRPIAKDTLEKMLQQEQVETAAESVVRLGEPAKSRFAERRLISRKPARSDPPL